MLSTAELTATTSEAPLHQQVADALEDGALPISKLLRLMWALDTEQSTRSDSLRAQLRARIGAPLNA